jgi:uncharacterized protein (UPF0332 family)
MSEEENRNAVIAYWTAKAEEALASARSELDSERLSFAVNRAYYACFYSASAVLLKEGRRFKKHSGVRAELHRALVKTKRLQASWGRFYNYVFENREKGDYQGLVTFEKEQVVEIVDLAQGFVAEIRKLLDAPR